MRVIDLTRSGKSLPIFGSRVKPQSKKYFALSEVKSVAYICPSRPTQRASAVVTDVGGSWWTQQLRLTSVTEAYGEVVWS